MKDSERIKALSQGVSDVEWREIGCRVEVGKVKKQIEEARKEAREWKTSSQIAEVKMKTLGEFEVNLKKKEDETGEGGGEVEEAAW